jgi:Tfp pilus assembly protein PilF
VREGLETRDAVWVQVSDFDEAMLLIRDTFDLPHPERSRFDDVFQNYFESYKKLSAPLSQSGGATAESAALQQAVRRADEAFADWPAVELAASRLKDSEPERAQAIYDRGLKQFPLSAPLLSNYAVFLAKIRKDYGRAEEYFRRALKADPKHAALLGNYAVFLQTIRKDYDGAEEHFRRTLEEDPKHANNLGNYANFLTTIRKDYDRAEVHFRRALEEDPGHANNLGNYAKLLESILKQYDRAEEYYRRALEADPNDANNLGNYAGFLLGYGRHEEGLALLDRVLADDELSDKPALAAECWFYALVHRPPDKQAEALEQLKKILLAGSRSPGWDLGPHLAHAKARGRADLTWLEKLAAVISNGADIATLKGWEEWDRVS